MGSQINFPLIVSDCTLYNLNGSIQCACSAIDFRSGPNYNIAAAIFHGFLPNLVAYADSSGNFQVRVRL